MFLTLAFSTTVIDSTRRAATYIVTCAHGDHQIAKQIRRSELENEREIAWYADFIRCTGRKASLEVTFFFPPLVTAFRIMFSPAPQNLIQKIRHREHWILAALVVAIVLLLTSFIAGMRAPDVSPFKQLWNYTIKPFVTPTPEYSVLLIVGAIIATMALVSYLICLWVGTKLAGGRPDHRKSTTYIALYSAIGAAVFCLIATLITCGLGWLLAALGIRIHVFKWMMFVTVPVAGIAAWWIARVFHRAGFIIKGLHFYSIMLSAYITFPCALGSTMITAYLDHALAEHGKAVNEAHRLPIAGVIQLCVPSNNDIACAITLWPVQWQDYELIGDWQQGTVDETGRKTVRFTWKPTQSNDKVIPVVLLQANQETTVEIHIPSQAACSYASSRITNADGFFFTRGRIKGMQQLAGYELRIRMDNMTPQLGDMINHICQSAPQPN